MIYSAQIWLKVLLVDAVLCAKISNISSSTVLCIIMKELFFSLNYIGIPTFQPKLLNMVILNLTMIQILDFLKVFTNILYHQRGSWINRLFIMFSERSYKYSWNKYYVNSHWFGGLSNKNNIHFCILTYLFRK